VFSCSPSLDIDQHQKEVLEASFSDACPVCKPMVFEGKIFCLMYEPYLRLGISPLSDVLTILLIVE